MPDTYDPRGLEPYIRARAQAYGIDPDIAVNVAKSEGLSNPIGDHGKSFGAFQLYTGGGLGNDFQRATGLDPSDPKNEQAGIDYALSHASQHGWGAFHGANRVGIGPFDGITVGSGGAVGAPGQQQAAPQAAPQQPGLSAGSPPQGLLAGGNPQANPQGLLDDAVDSELQKRLEAIPGMLNEMAQKQLQQGQQTPQVPPLNMPISPARQMAIAANMQNSPAAILRKQILASIAPQQQQQAQQAQSGQPFQLPGVG